MNIEVTDRLVSVVDKAVIGYLVSAGGNYKVAITEAFGVDHNISDMSCAKWLELPEHDVVPCGRKQYAMLGNQLGCMEELSWTPVEELGDTKAFYGHIFKEQHIVPLDSEFAFLRMIKEANGELFE